VTTFNIGTQRADVISNVGGDMVVGAFHVGDRWRPEEVRAELARLDRELADAPLPADAKRELSRLVGEAAADARSGGDPHQVESRLQQVTDLLQRAGGVARAGAGTVEALTAAASALGPAGKTLAALLAAAI
jgi:hypothetical protein